jgi:hypothetical protein
LRTNFLITPLHFIAPWPLERGMKRTNLTTKLIALLC